MLFEGRIETTSEDGEHLFRVFHREKFFPNQQKTRIYLHRSSPFPLSQRERDGVRAKTSQKPTAER
jgi:hypothetical protein